MKRKISVFDIVVLTFLILFACSLFFLLFLGLMNALKSDAEATYYLKLPRDWAFENFSYVFSNFRVRVSAESTVRFFPILLNSIIYAGLGALLAAFVPMITAYMCAKFSSYKLSSVLYYVVVIVMMIPLVGTYPANIKLLNTLHLYDTIPGVMLQKMSFTGTYFLVYFAMVKGVDKSFSEAAYIDGAGEFTVLFRIYFPLLINTYFTVVLLLFVGFWNDYNTPMLYIPSYPTLSYSVKWLQTNADPARFANTNLKMCVALIVVIPILTLFIIFRDKLTGNLTVGGVKG